MSLWHNTDWCVLVTRLVSLQHWTQDVQFSLLLTVSMADGTTRRVQRTLTSCRRSCRDLTWSLLYAMNTTWTETWSAVHAWVTYFLPNVAFWCRVLLGYFFCLTFKFLDFSRFRGKWPAYLESLNSRKFKSDQGIVRGKCVFAYSERMMHGSWITQEYSGHTCDVHVNIS